MDINKARKMISVRLNACIMYLEMEHDTDYWQYTMQTAELIGFVRGRTNDPHSAECALLVKIMSGLWSRDLTYLWKLQKEWAEFRIGHVTK